MEVVRVMIDQYTYFFEIEGGVHATDFNDRSPLRITIGDSSPTYTLLSIQTDQSGAVGFLRHLHGQGFSLISLYRASRATFQQQEKGGLQ